MKRLLVSFILPVLNGERDISRCLLSIQNLRFPTEDHEVIIMDNGSTDRTHQLVHDLGFTIQIIPGVSVAALRNRGAMMARGDYLAFIDADVELAPDWVQKGVASFKDQRVLAIGGPRCIPEGATWVQRAWGLHLESHRPAYQPAPVSWLYSMAFIVRRDKFFAIGGFSEYLETAEDVDLCYRLGQRGIILYNPTMKAVHWGEDPDLKTFWRKEIWRGKGSLRGILTHGLRRDELPSIGYPLYMLCFLLLLGVSSTYDALHGQLTGLPLTLGLLVLPAVILAFNSVYRVGKLKVFLQLFILYFIYGLARAYSLVWASFSDGKKLIKDLCIL